MRVGISTGAVAKPHFVRTDATISLRLIDRDSENRWFSEAQAELAAPFRPEIGPLLRCIAVHGRTISEIILVVYHAIGDGMSAKYLLRDLLRGMQVMNLVRLPPRPALEASIVVMINGPMYHSAPAAYGMSSARLGLSIVLQPRFDAEDMLRLIDKHRVSHMHIVPTMFVRLLRLPAEVKKKYDLSSLRWITHGAAPCAPASSAR